MGRILVTEELADAGIEMMAGSGHDVDVRLGLSPDDLLGAVKGADALVVRSATKVTAAVFEAADQLTVVGRAGIGVDNIDMEAATRRGVMVANAPQSITLSTAEHTMAVLLALARNVPQAHSALVAGRWEKSKWEGVELYGKTLGVLGVGRIGTLVAQRAHAFGMRLVAWDPWMAAERARVLGIELLELDELLAQSDFITIHLLKTPDSVGLLGKDRLVRTKPGVRIVNVARGGIIDEDALAEALRSGQVAGAALDVFAEEPATASPLFEMSNVVVTPHLGASTRDAQDKAGVTIAEQVILALAGEFVPHALNVAAGEASDAVRPFLSVAEVLGGVFAALHDGAPAVLEISFHGGLAEQDTRILTLSSLKGLFVAAGITDPVSYVNAPQMAAERGIEIRETTSSVSTDYTNLITVSGAGHSVAGTVAGPRGESRIVMVDDHTVELAPSPNMLVVRNEDRPGMIGQVTSILGDAGVNISDMAVGRSPSGGAALMVLSTDAAVPPEVVDRVAAAPGIRDVHRAAVELPRR
ncbi:MAG TPA: phosphoglycerate dehydrogenase [Acidimicrobiales bacterium]|nr:phosphoglycerate dehydrogenase [Acidimicrobiales bacterium]